MREGGLYWVSTRAPKVDERVLDGVRDGGGRTDHAALADAAEVVLPTGRDRLEVVDLDVGDLHRRRQQVVHVGRRLHVGVVVVRRLLVEHRTDPLRHATADLAVDDRRVDDRPTVLDHEVAREGDETGLEIDVDDAGVGGHRPAAVALAAIDDRCAERGVAALAFDRAAFGHHRRGDIGDGESPRGDARHVNVAVDDLDVGRRGLEHLGRLFDELLAHLARRVLHRPATHRTPTAAAGPDEAERRSPRVAVDDLHVVA